MGEQMGQMPSPAELERIQKENLSEEQIEKDEIREETYEAGKIAGRKKILSIVDDVDAEEADNEERGYNDGNAEQTIGVEVRMEKENEDAADAMKLSVEQRNMFLENKFRYEYPYGKLCPTSEVNEKQILEFIEKIPGLYGYDVDNIGSISEKIIKAIVDKFPSAIFTLENLGSEKDYWRNKVKEMGGK
ncbi:MAG: hypothetical protein WC238_03010 [Parcubacteria group bacterium]|jgi:hypothetical protein